MKKIFFLILAFIPTLFIAQNTFPTSGNVGIGTTSPLTTLEVKNNQYKQLLLSNHGSEKFYLGSVWYSVGSFIANNSYYETSHKYMALDNISNGIQLRESGDIHLFSNSNLIANSQFLPTPRLTVKATGNVGIGTPTPTENLEIYDSNTTPGVISLKSSRNDAANVEVGRISAKQGGSEVARIGMLRGAGTYTGFLSFWTKSDNSSSLTERMRLSGNGNVGIGTTTPTTKLDINGSVNLNNQHSNSTDYLNPGYYVYKSSTTAYGMKLQYSSGKYGTMIFGPNQSNRFIGFGKVGNELKDSKMIEYMRVDLNNGNVGIGTTTPDSKLTVKGKIHAQEVKVTVNAGADFVFEKEYDLPSLQSVEKFITENKHLPEIASAKEMEKNGIHLSEMNIKLLQKIEELTLYTIQQEKAINQLLTANSQQLKTNSQQQLAISEERKANEEQRDEIEKLKKENTLLKQLNSEIEQLKERVQSLEIKN